MVRFSILEKSVLNQLLTFVRRGNHQRFAVLGDCASSDLDPLLAENADDGLVAVGFFGIFAQYDLSDFVLNAGRCDASAMGSPD